jgi:hypothetical protein
MASTEKSSNVKKSLFKRLLKWFGILFIVLIAILIMIPILYKDKILDLIVEEANKELTSELTIEDFDLTILKTFPKLTMELKGVRIAGKDEFEGLDLIRFKSFEAKLDFWSVVGGDQIEIESIKLTEPYINIKILANGKANYDITKPDSLKTEEEISEPSSFKLGLKSYEIIKGEISYIDKEGDMSSIITNLNHSGQGDLTESIVDFKTKTTADAITVIMEGIPYLAQVKTDMTINLRMEFNEKSTKFTLLENEVALNAFKTSYNGFFEMFDDYYEMDLTLDASKSTFKEFISLIPSVFQSGYESMLTKGTFALNGMLKGRMDDNEMPAWDFNLAVDNASFRYPDLGAGFDKITLRANTKRAQGANLDNIQLDVDKFHIEFVGNTIDAILKMRTPMSDPYISSRILAHVDLSTLEKVMPVEAGESYNGMLDSDVHLDGKMSAIDNEEYDKFTAEGWLTLKDMIYKSADFTQPIEIQSMVFNFNPKNLGLSELQAKIGKSDFALNGTIDNYLGYALRDEVLTGRFAFVSNTLDLDELMGLSPEEESTVVSEEATTENTTTEEPIQIPATIDFDLSTSIKQMNYDGMDIKNVKGNVRLKESVASMDNVQMNMLGGQIVLKGDFDTKNPNQPRINFAYDLKDIDIKELSDNFVTIEKLSPITKNATGKISTSLEMQGDLTSNLDMVIPSLTGKGNFFTNKVTISGVEALTKLSDELKMPQLREQTLENVRANFEFYEGKLFVKPFDVKLGKITSNIEGWTSFTSEIEYKMKMNVPKDQIPAEMIKLTEQAIGQLNNLSPKLSVQGLPAIIPVKVTIGGTATKPVVKADFKESLMAASGNVKDQLKDLVDEKIAEIKDTITKVVTEKIEDVKEDLIERKNKIMADAQKQADKVKAEGKKQADVIRNESDKQAKDVIAKAKNPIEKKVAEKTADEIRKQGEIKAKKVEDEANKQADKIMADAKTQADKLN